MNSKYKDKLVGVYAPGNYGHTSVLDQTQAFSRWFWSNHEDMEFISAKREIAEQLGVSASTIGYYGTPVYARRTSESKGRRLVEL